MTEEQKEKYRENQRARYRRRVASGLCIYCDNPADKPHIRCKIHREIVSDYSAGKRDIRKVKGLCADCGRKPPREGFLSCEDCSRNRSKYYRNGKENVRTQIPQGSD